MHSLKRRQFQGGAFDPYGGWGFDQCSILVNHEFERVFYKNNFASGVTIFNIYMVRTPVLIRDNMLERNIKLMERGMNLDLWRY